ncbi:MAG: cysteine desulfurase [Alphaproteobacteria bacterium]|nr:cysteine desulfurase [Alphaproteobacteria bacterium]
MKQIIYADNAATTKLDIEAFEAMKPFLLDNYANASQPYSFSREAKKALREARRIIADCINADIDEIYFTSCGSESDNWAIKGVAYNGEQGAIITSEIEHHAVLRACEDVEKSGTAVAYVKPNNEGIICPEVLADYITDNTKLVSIMFVNNEIGTIEPIKGLAEVAHKHGAIFHTDAVQAVGHVRIDVKELGIDMLSASAHKFNGPKGIGFLYIRKGTAIRTLINGGAQEFGIRAGTENIAAIVGMAKALKNNCDFIDENNRYVEHLEELLLKGLEGISFARNGSDDHVKGIISLSFPEEEGETILHRLDLMGIMVSTGSACDSVNTQISHVLKAIRLDEILARGTIRISLSKNNKVEEVETIAKALRKVVARKA